MLFRVVAGGGRNSHRVVDFPLCVGAGKDETRVARDVRDGHRFWKERTRKIV